MLFPVLSRTIIGSILLVALFWTVDAHPRNAVTENERTVTNPQAAIRQAAPVVAPIPITVDGKTIFANTTGVDVGGPPFRNSPPQQSDPVPLGSNIGSVVRVSTAPAVTLSLPSSSVVVAAPPRITTSVISVVPLPSSSSAAASPTPPTSQSILSLVPLPPTPSSSPIIAPPPSSSSKSSSSVVIISTASASTAIPPLSTPVVFTAGLSTTVKLSVPASTSTATKAAPVAAGSTTVKSTVLVLARDSASAYSAYSGLNGIGISYQLVLVPQAGITLPVLNTSSTLGNYGAIVILSEVSYNYGTSLGFQSALSAAQWASLYQYQLDFGVRMVRLDVFPGPAFGTRVVGGCCNATVEQLISISDISKFPTSGLQM
jgi:hypothetical protein